MPHLRSAATPEPRSHPFGGRRATGWARFSAMPNVLVTGAARGIGRATTLRLATSGWDVLAGVRQEADGAALAAEMPDRITPVLLDVTSASDVAALDTHLPATLDAVVNNAGVAVGGPVE